MKITIKNDGVNEIEIKKSKFISYAFFVSNKNDVEKYLSYIRTKHSDATHICYAYVVDGLVGQSDNGEPSGTAGVPILDVLQKKKLQNVLVLVVRYFGGIKLGAGGLVRAYSKSASSVIDNVGTKELQKYDVYCLICPLSLTKTIEFVTKNIGIIKNIEYGEKAKYTIWAPKNTDIKVFDKYDIEIIKEDCIWV